MSNNVGKKNPESQINTTTCDTEDSNGGHGSDDESVSLQRLESSGGDTGHVHLQSSSQAAMATQVALCRKAGVPGTKNSQP